MEAHAATVTSASTRTLLGVPVAFVVLLAALLLPPGGVLALAATTILLAAAALAELRRDNPLGLPAQRPGMAE